MVDSLIGALVGALVDAIGLLWKTTLPNSWQHLWQVLQNGQGEHSWLLTGLVAITSVGIVIWPVATATSTKDGCNYFGVDRFVHQQLRRLRIQLVVDLTTKW